MVGIKDYPLRDTTNVVMQKYLRMLSSLYVGPIPKIKKVNINRLAIGSFYYKKALAPISCNIMRGIPSDKALGPDLIPDKWIRKRRNGEQFAKFTELWM